MPPTSSARRSPASRRRSPRRWSRSRTRAHADRRTQPAERNPATAHLFIINPLIGRAAWTTCSRPIRRPRTASRRSQQLAGEMGRGGMRRRDGRPAPTSRAARGRGRPAVRARRAAPGATRHRAAPGADRPAHAFRRGRHPRARGDAVSCTTRGMTAPRAPPSSPHRPASPRAAIAADILDGVLRRHRPLDEQLEDRRAGLAALGRARPRAGRASWSAIGAAPARHAAAHLLGRLLERGLPADAPRVETALLLGAAQILLLDVPDHAAVDLSVRLVQADRRAARYAGLVNAVLRRIARDGAQRLAALDTAAARHARLADGALDRDLRRRDRARHRGRQRPGAGARPHGQERSRRTGPSALGGRVLPTGSVRAVAHGPVPPLPGYRRGRLVGAGRRRGAAGAAARRRRAASASPISAPRPAARPRSSPPPARSVTAVDRAPTRLERLRQNLARLGLAAEIVAADAARMAAAGRSTPCCSTRRARRPAPSAAIPTFPGSSARADIAALAALQRRLLEQRRRAAQAGRHAGLLHLLARARGRRGRRSRDLLAREPRAAPPADRGRRSRRPRPSC